MLEGNRNTAIRAINAENNFADTLIEIAGITREEAFKVISVYRKAKIVKTDFVGGRMHVKHGAFLNVEVILRAVKA